MSKGSPKNPDSVIFGVVQIIAILLAVYVAFSHGKEILTSVVFLVVALILSVIGGGLILYFLRQALIKSRLAKNPGTPRS